MKKQIQKIIGKFLSITLLLSLMQTLVISAHAQIIFKNEFLIENDEVTEAWIIDSGDDSSGNIKLQFGNAIGESITWDTTNSWFGLSGDISLGQNELKNVALDNQATAPITPVDGQIYYNTTDGNTYVYNGSTWEDITLVGGGSVDLDGAYDNDGDQTLNVDHANGLEFESTVAGNVTFDLQSTGDFVIQNAGSDFAIFNNGGTFDLIGQPYIADSHVATDSDGTINLGRASSTWQTLSFDYVNDWFEFSNDVSLNENKLLEAEIENVSALPGGAGGLGTAGEGRIVISDTQDTTAPGCTVDPWCPAGTYIWDGAAWISLVGSPSSTNLTKVVTVGSSGFDYTNIDGAATYLATRSGGIMLLSAETHAITTAVDLTNVRLVGKDATRTTIEISAGGQLDTFDTIFEYLTIETTATLTDDMAIDVQSGASSLIFNYIDFDIATGTDVLIDSNEGTAPTIVAKFIKSNAAATNNGSILKPEASANINTASDIFIDSRSSDDPLELEDWDVTLAGGGSVNTTGTITSVPAQTIYVSPNMNLQGAIDSLEVVGTGGLITLLPGTHTITSTLTIEDDSIEIIGYGDSSIISASGFTGGATVAAIQIGSADSTSTVNGVVLQNFKLEVTGTGASDIHGIRVCGGKDNKIDNITIEKVSGVSGSGSGARMGIQMIDGTSGCTGTCTLTRPVITKSRVLGGSGAYFTDGIHVTSDGDITGVWGNDQGVLNALVDGNNIDYIGETAYVFVGVNDSSLFNNRASNMAGGGSGYGIYIGNATNINMTANVFSSSLAATSPAIGIESFNSGSLKEVVDSIFANNIIDGTANGGVGFQTGFLIGNAVNTNVFRNSFHSNTIAGASTATTTAINVRGNADDNTFSNNNITGGTNAWDTGVNLTSSTQERNLVRGNRNSNVTTILSDSGTSTKLGVGHHRSTSDPTVNDDTNDGYGVGTVWVNTSTDDSFLSTDSTVGAANWEQINGGGSSVPGTTLAAVQARRTTDYTLVSLNTWYDITLNATDVETDATVVEHDNTNTDQIDIKEDGTYRITYQVNANSSGVTHRLDSRVRVNDTTVLNGSLLENVNYNGEYSPTTATFIAELSTNDYITLQAQRTTANTIINETTLTVVKLEGIEGADGATGADGADGADGDSINWLGAWSAVTSYVIDDAVEDNGTSYIATANNLNDQPPSANWDILAQKGADGSAGTLDDAYNSDTGERTVTADDGDVSWDITSTYNNVIDLQGTGDFQIQNNSVNFAVFDDSGNITFSNDLTVVGPIYNTNTATKYLWLDINGAVRTSASTGSVNSGTSPVIRFDGVNNSRARWSFPVPDDWESGTDIEIEVFWSPADGNAGNVYFTLEYQSWADGETISGSTALNSTEAAPGTTLQLDAFAFTVPNASLSANDMVNIRLNRLPGNVADTYASAINIHMIRINYTGKKLL